MIDDKHTTG